MEEATLSVVPTYCKLPLKGGTLVLDRPLPEMPGYGRQRAEMRQHEARYAMSNE
jgi:hypothetical protein